MWPCSRISNLKARPPFKPGRALADVFPAWLRVCFAEGPRQVINALTLYSVMRADLVPTGSHAAKDGHTPIVQFFVNLQILAGTEKEQAAILFGMLYTLVIWVFSALSLIVAVIFYIVFLWHHIREGSLSKYCRRKVDTRLHKIVMVKVNKALEKEDQVRAKQEGKGMGGPRFPEIKRQPTLPDLNADGPLDIPPISRQTTQTEFSPFESRPSTPINKNSSNVLSRQPTVPDVFSNSARPQAPSRGTTQSSAHSNISYADDAPLMASAGAMGYARSGSRNAPSRMGSAGSNLPSSRPPGRSFTGSSQGTQRTFNSTVTRMDFPTRSNTDMSGRSTPGSYALQPQVRKPPPGDMSFSGGPGRPPGPSGPSRRPTQEYEMQAQPAVNGSNVAPSNGGYVAYNPNAQVTPGSGFPRPSTPSTGPPPARNFTLPHQPPQDDYFGPNPGKPQRSGTAPIPELRAFNGSPKGAYAVQQPPTGPVPYRPATAGLDGWSGQRGPMPPRF